MNPMEIDEAVSRLEGDAPMTRGYTVRWDLAGPIIERERISVYQSDVGGWCAAMPGWLKRPEMKEPFVRGETPLIAAMRAYLHSRPMRPDDFPPYRPPQPGRIRSGKPGERVMVRTSYPGQGESVVEAHPRLAEQLLRGHKFPYVAIVEVFNP